MPTREATTHWRGGLQEGSGYITMDSSRIGRYDVSFPKRAAEEADGTTSPEELIAAAHSSCMAMSMSGVLDAEGLTAESIDITASVRLGPDPAGGFAIRKISVRLTASVPGLAEGRFQELAKQASDNCPVSKALTGTEIALTATLA